VTPEELRPRLVSAGLARHADALVALARPSVRLRSSPRPDDEFAVATTKLGGSPDLPASFRWPENDGRPLSFIAQVNLRETSATLSDERLPAAGLLSFFYDAIEQPWGYLHDHRGSSVVVFSPAGVELMRHDPPEELPDEGRFKPFALDPALEITYAPPESSHTRELGFTFDEEFAYSQLFDEDRPPKHRLLGHPDPMQGDMQRECQLVTNGIDLGGVNEDPREAVFLSGAVDWRLLLQIDTEDDAGMMWGDAGRIYYWIRDQDLVASAWDATWIILQC
jgi:uncharacterized protein YwqG